MKKTLILLLNLIAVISLHGQSINLKTNSQFEFDIRTVNNIPQLISDHQYTFWFRMVGKEGANTVLDCKLVKANVSEQSENSVNKFNTDSIRNTSFNSTQVFLPLTLLQKTLTITISPKGEVLKIAGIDEAIAEAAAKWVLKDEFVDQMKQNAKSFPLVTIQNMLLRLPEKEIGYETAWKAADGMFYKVTTINGALFTIKLSDKAPDDKIGGGISGISSFNTVTGLLEQVKNTGSKKTEISIAGKKKLLPQFSYSQSIRYGARSYPVDTAWINMAAKTCYFSAALMKNNVEYDSAKVYNYFKAHDAQFQNDPYYLVKRLDLVQQAMMRNGYKIYDSVLVRTPTHFIKDHASHLFNKIGSVVDISPDSAYEVSTYLRKTPQFDSWLQESFAQSFISFNAGDEHGEEPRKANAYRLLELFHQDKDPLVQYRINALYMWVNAKIHLNEPGFLTQTGNSFMHMDDKYMQLGNGGRYTMLTYKLLKDAGQTKEAEGLLTNNIKVLERYTADTLNKNHYANQNILAYAYYLKYGEAKVTDPENALQYLSKAALYSPKNEKDKAYTSFYDRAFLQSKESYRDEFIEKLFSSGNEEQGLKVFIQHVNVEPASISEMQKVYESHFPGKSFKAFFANNIVPTWQQAPAFTLKGMDGKELTLDSFKNKWLVLDFWGTWCSPCREEMPGLNVFNQELKAGKHDGINFLSIACNDEESRVKSYFAANKIDLPVVMSNGVVEQQYKIGGYPRKILISPGGKMLLIEFGQDWKNIVTQFNQLYSVN
jgi:thiol-disulfide isomerase/thioredoxin